MEIHEGQVHPPNAIHNGIPVHADYKVVASLQNGQQYERKGDADSSIRAAWALSH